LSDPRAAGGDNLVRVARAANQAEAELIEDILREEGIPCVQRRTRGFDVPDFLAAGPRDVLVPAAAAQAARELLYASPVRGATKLPEEPVAGVSAWRLALGLGLALVVAAAVLLAVALLAG
jgi:hypothetical protein